MSLARQFRAAEAPKPVAMKPLEGAPAKPVASAIPTSPGQKRGPKPSGNAKVQITLRLDQAVIAKFKATGEGWQARMNDVLKAAKV